MERGENPSESSAAPAGDDLILRHVPCRAVGQRSASNRILMHWLARIFAASDLLNEFVDFVHSFAALQDVSTHSGKQRKDTADDQRNAGIALTFGASKEPHQKGDHTDYGEPEHEDRGRPAVADQHHNPDDEASESEGGGGTGAVHAAGGPDVVPDAQRSRDGEHEVEVGAGMIFIDECSDEVWDFAINTPKDMGRAGDALQDGDEAEDRAADHHRGEDGLHGVAAGESGPQRAGQQPRPGVNDEHAPGVHGFKRRPHTRRQPRDVRHRQDGVTAIGNRHITPCGVKRLRRDVGQQQQPEPEDRKTHELRPHEQAEFAFARVVGRVVPRDERDDEPEGREAERRDLAPRVHRAERPRHEDELRARDDDEGLLERMQRQRGAHVAAEVVHGAMRLGLGRGGRRVGHRGDFSR